MSRGRVALLCVALVSVSACVPAAGSQKASPDAAGLLAALGEPRTEDTGAHYDRDAWGGWASHGGGCNTREAVLAEQAVAGSTFKRGKGCTPLCPVPAGSAPVPCWVSLYDGVSVVDPNDLQVDHIVPVKEANRSGARGWSAARRTEFYNDRTNLWAVTGKSNGSKSDRDPGKWKPADRTSWCAYATAYAQVKTKYALHVDQAERAGLVAMLNTCPTGGVR
ncbi:Protein of unknown function [Actinokineospora alba]|uniref:GmrSD restriction endonucleases C-terminal domain-containing protein n=1 Tax=Actinokineospora alba TaxID=504798 RepID=A0A1H0T7P0_9PSEU|nr:HNH endonuclease family protein [Actinokineospora alba]TDP66326.1 uncharacterized protein DUF1524 [Actinokineospora alba]SDJ22049.1 Protein of unknown function [Actinokineospora alba]SDP50039.1 Protein of unknown function [Actinokineospora alba]